MIALDAPHPADERRGEAQGDVAGHDSTEHHHTALAVSKLSDAHRVLLEASAVDPEVAARAGVRTVDRPADLPEEFASWRRTTNITPGLLFPSSGPAGGRTMQYRPDTAVELEGEDRPRKYLFPTGATPVVAVHPDMVDRITEGDTLLVVEGTKQALAAMSAAPASVLVAGIAGCQGWRSDGVPLADWDHLNVDGRHVVIAFDADLATNRNVHDAAMTLVEAFGTAGAQRWLALVLDEVSS